MAAQWQLSFMPAQEGDRRLHTLEVKSSQKEIRVSAPVGVFLP
jgi:hypothetical protein